MSVFLWTNLANAKYSWRSERGFRLVLASARSSLPCAAPNAPNSRVRRRSTSFFADRSGSELVLLLPVRAPLPFYAE